MFVLLLFVVTFVLILSMSSNEARASRDDFFV